METVEKVMSVKDYSQQYKTVAMLLDTLFPVSLFLHVTCMHSRECRTILPDLRISLCSLYILMHALL